VEWLCITELTAARYAALQIYAVYLKQYIGTVTCRHF